MGMPFCSSANSAFICQKQMEIIHILSKPHFEKEQYEIFLGIVPMVYQENSAVFFFFFGNTKLALWSQYACGHISFLTVRLVENMNEFLAARISLTLDDSLMDMYHIGNLPTVGNHPTGPPMLSCDGVRGCDRQTDRRTDGRTDRQTDRQTDRRKRRKYIWILQAQDLRQDPWQEHWRPPTSTYPQKYSTLPRTHLMYLLHLHCYLYSVNCNVMSRMASESRLRTKALIDVGQDFVAKGLYSTRCGKCIDAGVSSL